ncbi:hypothetical protein ACHQM5_021391 [Ranunculus cassubicifolius]
MIYTDLKHFSHNHNLKPECDGIPFRCDGCMEPGWGPRYRCDGCNYDLHQHCAVYTATIFHSMCKNNPFKFLQSGPDNKHCNACGRDVLGFSYRCNDRDYDLHPSCANLPMTGVCDGVEIHLRESHSVKAKCNICGNKESKSGRRGWSYRSACKKYHFHVSCVIDVGIKNWEEEYFAGRRPGMELTVIPSLQLTAMNYGASSSGGKINKYWRITKLVFKLIISTVIGDPITGITSLAESIFSG